AICCADLCRLEAEALALVRGPCGPLTCYCGAAGAAPAVLVAVAFFLGPCLKHPGYPGPNPAALFARSCSALSFQSIDRGESNRSSSWSAQLLGCRCNRFALKRAKSSPSELRLYGPQRPAR